MKIADGKKLGEWVGHGLCVLDREGNVRKAVGASSNVVVKNYGEESEALSDYSYSKFEFAQKMRIIRCREDSNSFCNSKSHR